jgi:signal transduction histidine kinase/ActR/RegA family two-component response regulator
VTTVEPISDAVRLQKRLDREKAARLSAEQLLEEKSLALFKSNEELRSLTERLRSEIDKQTADLRLALQQAGIATKAKDEFLANLSHEVRTPLNAIIGVIRLFRKTSLDEEQAKYVHLMEKSSTALLELLNDVLDFSKIEAGRLAIETVSFSLIDWIDDTLAPYALQAQSKGIAFSLDMDPALPKFILGDPGRVRQVLINLVSNALKFTKQGEVLVKVLRLPPPPGHPAADLQLGFKVRDTGEGIPEASLGTIFEAFTQADASTTRRYGGTGLGLAICQRLVQAMGGKLSVKSTLGHGSEFRFRLPVQEAVQQQSGATRPMSYDEPNWNGLRVLVAEDHPINQFLMRKLLEDTGCSLAIVADGQKALLHWETQPVDLILMDLQMPIMDGVTATRAIRQKERTRGSHTKIIALTAHALPGDAERCNQAGMDGYVTKPISIEALNTVVANVLKRTATPLPLIGDTEFEL